MKRVVKASFEGDYDPSTTEDWVQDLCDQIKTFVSSLIKEMGESRYYKCRIKEISEDRYGYPVIVVGIYNGSRLTREIDVGTWNTDTDEEIHTLDDTTREYLRDEIEYIIGG